MNGSENEVLLRGRRENEGRKRPNEKEGKKKSYKEIQGAGLFNLTQGIPLLTLCVQLLASPRYHLASADLPQENRPCFILLPHNVPCVEFVYLHQALHKFVWHVSICHVGERARVSNVRSASGLPLYSDSSERAPIESLLK